MAQANICIRLDENLKKQFDAFCNEIGMTMSTAINIFVKKVLKENRIPFELSTNTPNAETIKTIEDTQKGIGLSKAYSDMDEMFKDLGI